MDSGTGARSGCKARALCKGAAVLAIKHAVGCIMQAKRLLVAANHIAQSFIVAHRNATITSVGTSVGQVTTCCREMIPVIIARKVVYVK